MFVGGGHSAGLLQDAVLRYTNRLVNIMMKYVSYSYRRGLPIEGSSSPSFLISCSCLDCYFVWMYQIPRTFSS